MGWKKCPPFTVTVKGDWKKILEDVKKKAKSKDVEFKGNTEKGSFINKAKDVKGTYTISGKKITLNTQENMYFGNCADVQKVFREFLKGK